MHFILEEKEKELIGNIKLSSVTAENNLVFCSVACDLVWSLRWQASSCLECKAHRCLTFYSLLWSKLFALVLEAGCSSEHGVWVRSQRQGAEVENTGASVFRAMLQQGTGDQRAACSSCCSSGGLSSGSIPIRNKAEQNWAWEFL